MLGALVLVALSQMGSGPEQAARLDCVAVRGTSVRRRRTLASATSVSCFEIGSDDRSGTDVVVRMYVPLRPGAARGGEAPLLPDGAPGDELHDPMALPGFCLRSIMEPHWIDKGSFWKLPERSLDALLAHH